MTESRTRDAEHVREQFYHDYAQWQIECHQPKVRIMSDARVFTSLPGYRGIVSLGRPALPFLQDRMEHDSGFDYMLVYAAMDIEGWKHTDLPPNLTYSVQEDRDHVLAKMRAHQ
jgi:hypothetical protein